MCKGLSTGPAYYSDLDVLAEKGPRIIPSVGEAASVSTGKILRKRDVRLLWQEHCLELERNRMV